MDFVLLGVVAYERQALYDARLTSQLPASAQFVRQLALCFVADSRSGRPGAADDWMIRPRANTLPSIGLSGQQSRKCLICNNMRALALMSELIDRSANSR